MATKWEYTTLTFNVSEVKEFKLKANKLGAEGWELVAMIPLEAKTIGFFDSGSETSAIVASFKKPVE
jgi:hypothetical protein